ncbi:33780_t:CDS:2, partial [Racocetra persica]
MSAKKQEQIQQFLTNKVNVIMSSYKTDSATNEPVYYLKDSKNVLWEWFYKEYPDGMKHSSFYVYLQGNQYIYRENLGGLCQTCSKYGYDTFDEISDYIQGNIKCHYTVFSNGKNSLPGNSNWFEWQWPITGKFAGCILMHAISNIRNWKIFSPADLEKLCKKDIHKPNPEISTHTTPCSDWEISIPNTSHLNPTCLNKRNLIKELSLRGIEVNEKENRSILVLNLKIQLENDIKNAKLGCDINPGVLIISSTNTINFSLPSGWALKKKQKYREKGIGKRIAKNEADKSDHYTAQDMYEALQQRVLEGEIEAEAIPKVSTIQSWIGYYTRQYREYAAQM